MNLKNVKYTKKKLTKYAIIYLYASGIINNYT